ncbi:hypothetical protein [Micromonospora violae]|uniref:hypothetical protein n=1 Tax=Micromonospora violae TaxID=1278207 RepID=UPI0013EF299C|nr:hypothetical protein [Micromonospora violae]
MTSRACTSGRMLPVEPGREGVPENRRAQDLEGLTSMSVMSVSHHDDSQTSRSAADVAPAIVVLGVRRTDQLDVLVATPE